MRNLLIAATLAVVGVFLNVRAALPVVNAEPTLERLVAQLGDEDYAARDKAAHATPGRPGEKAIPVLP